LSRARLAESIILHRIKKRKFNFKQVKTECIGYNAILGDLAEKYASEPFEVRLRSAVKADTDAEARIVGDEVESLFLNGPAGAAGARKHVRPVVAMYSTTTPRELIEISMQIKEVG